MTNVAHDTNKNNGKTNGKGAWKLTDKEREERRSTADELSQQNERDRSRLLQAKARAAEVKELIKATDLGAEAEELKDEIKHLETSIDARSETVERCLREARTGKTDRQQDTLPGVPPAADKSPPPPRSAPRPSAAERTVPLLPEWSGPTTGEAEVHPGGELAPEPPAPPPLALPPRVEAIEAEIVDEAAEARAREAWRALVLDALGEEGPLPFDLLHTKVLDGSYEREVAEPDTAQIKALLAVMVDAGAIVLEGERYALPTPPKGKKGEKKAPAKKAAPKSAPKAKKAARAPKRARGPVSPARSLTDDIEAELREWGTWYDAGQLEAKIREKMPLTSGPSSRDWKETVLAMMGQHRIERREVDGRMQLRIRGDAPAAPPVDWRQERKNAVSNIAFQHKACVPIDDGTTASRVAITLYLESAGALVSTGEGKFELSCEIDDARVSEGVWRMSLDYLLDQIEENAAANGGVGPTAANLADMLEAPAGLVDDLVAELVEARRLRKVPQTTGAPRLAVLPSPKGRKLPQAEAAE